ncbi:MAG: alpha/beta hydrolase [Pseudomonadota bacterium]|nr:alpha/beta hydrolase [Pseudomonadota bacterium]
MYRRSCLDVACATLAFGIATFCVARNSDLPRKSSTPNRDESYPGVTVQYDTIGDCCGNRLRLIVTHPQRDSGRIPAIFVVGWLSCDSVEAPPGTTDATQLVLQAVAKLPGFATMRMDKAGVGDSEGKCGSTDFTAELDSYRRAFRKLRDYPFVDTNRVFVFGISNGGGFAPLVAEGAPVRGYVVDGGWIKTWYEHMLEIERRRLKLSGHPSSEINSMMKSVEALYSAYLLNRESPQQIFEKSPELKKLWEGEPNQQYGRPVAYYQQLQDLNLMAVWSHVKEPVLALHGEFDWIMSRSDLELMAELVNRNAPGAAEFVELPVTGHTFEHYSSMETAFSGMALPFDDHIAVRIREWFKKHRE